MSNEIQAPPTAASSRSTWKIFNGELHMNAESVVERVKVSVQARIRRGNPMQLYYMVTGTYADVVAGSGSTVQISRSGVLTHDEGKKLQRLAEAHTSFAANVITEQIRVALSIDPTPQNAEVIEAAKQAATPELEPTQVLHRIAKIDHDDNRPRLVTTRDWAKQWLAAWSVDDLDVSNAVAELGEEQAAQIYTVERDRLRAKAATKGASP